VTVTDQDQLSSSKTFTINVTSPKEAVNTSLNKKLSDLSNVESQLEDSKFEDSLREALDFETLSEDLNRLEQDYEQASSEEDYEEIMTSLLSLEIPESVNIVESTNLITFYPDKDNIDLEIVTDVGGGSYDMEDEEEYIDAIISWNLDNMDTKVVYSEFSASYGYFDEVSILRAFGFQIDKKSDFGDVYLIIFDLENIEFLGDYDEREESGYFYIDLEQDSQLISFTTTESVDFFDVPVFISPRLEKLELEEGIGIASGKNFKWMLFIFILVLIAIFGIVGYILLQEWYKRRYENYLFKNRNDLYNLMIFITAEKKKATTGKEIYERLKKAGWSSEQIRYALKKHSGKRTGMVEIISLGKKKKIEQPKGMPLQRPKHGQLRRRMPFARKVSKNKTYNR